MMYELQRFVSELNYIIKRRPNSAHFLFSLPPSLSRLSDDSTLPRCWLLRSFICHAALYNTLFFSDSESAPCFFSFFSLSGLCSRSLLLAFPGCERQAVVCRCRAFHMCWNYCSASTLGLDCLFFFLLCFHTSIFLSFFAHDRSSFGEWPAVVDAVVGKKVLMTVLRNANKYNV